jgi:hypothetical protein
MVLVASAVLTLPVSLVFLHVYRRRVLVAMASSARAERYTAPEESVRPVHSPPATEIVLGEDSPTITSEREAESLRLRCVRRPWYVAGVYAAAGLTFASLLTVAEMRAADIAFAPTRFLLLLGIFAWPLVPTIAIVAASSRRTKLAIAAAYFGGLGVLSVIGAARSPDVEAWQLALPWLAINLVPSLLLPAVFARRVRAVGPLVLAFLAAAFVGAMYAEVTLASDPRALRVAAEVGVRLGLSAGGIILGVVLIGLAVFGVGGWLLLTALRRAYERKWASDQSITVDAIWLLFALAGGAFITNNGALWILSAPAAFTAYVLVAAVGFRLLGRRERALAKARPARLLLLRAFSLGRRSEHLYHVIDTHWRHVGSIQLISGPDLATTTVEPHEFLDFLRGQLARRFIDAPAALETRVKEMDLRPDLDGRYRVNDFFCHDDTWRLVLRRLVAETDLALIDLRGFTTCHAGCVFEIKALVDAVPLERIVILTDDGTDEAYLRQVIRAGWAEVRADSPNRDATSPRLRLLRLRQLGSREITEIVWALAHAATVRDIGVNVASAPTVADRDARVAFIDATEAGRARRRPSGRRGTAGERNSVGGGDGG